MPRTHTTAEREIFDSGQYVDHLDVLVEKPQGAGSVMQSYRSRIIGLRWSPSSPRAPISTGSVTLAREAAGVSIAPLITASPLNRDGGLYAPAIDKGREIEIRTATLPRGQVPAASDWKTVFRGLTGSPDWGGKDSPILTLPFGGRSTALSETFVRDKLTYGTGDGVDAFSVMQALADATMGPGQYPLQDATTGPRFAVTGYTVIDVAAWEALQKLALSWGGKVLLEQWHGGIAVVSPDREKTVPDYAITPKRYIDVPEIAGGAANLRTIVRGEAEDRTTGATLVHQIPPETDVDADPLVQKYGKLYLKFSPGSTSQVGNQAELVAMVEAAYRDVSQIAYPLRIETRYCWFALPNDLVEWGANAKHFDLPLAGAVLHLTHEFDAASGKGRTYWECTAAPVGATAAEWERRTAGIAGINAAPPATSASLKIDVSPSDLVTLTYSPLDATLEAKVNGLAVTLSVISPGVRTYQMARSEASDQRFVATASAPDLDPASVTYTIDRDDEPGLSGFSVSDRRTRPIIHATMDDDANHLRILTAGAEVYRAVRSAGSSTASVVYGTVQVDYAVTALATDATRPYTVEVSRDGASWKQVWSGSVTGPPPDTNTITAGLKLEVDASNLVMLTYTPADAEISATLNGSTVPLSGSAAGVRTYQMVRSEASDQRFVASVTKAGIGPATGSYTIDRDDEPGISGITVSDRRPQPVLHVTMDDDAQQLRVLQAGAEVFRVVRGAGASTASVLYGSVQMDYVCAALATDATRSYTLEASKDGSAWKQVWAGTVTGPSPDTNTITASISAVVGAESGGAVPITLTYTPADASIAATVNGANVSLAGSTPGTRTYSLARSEASDQRFLATVTRSGVQPASFPYLLDRDDEPGISGITVSDRRTQPIIHVSMDDDAQMLRVKQGGAEQHRIVRGAGTNTSTVTYGGVHLDYLCAALAFDASRSYTVEVSRDGAAWKEVWAGSVTGPVPITDGVSDVGDPVPRLDGHGPGFTIPVVADADTAALFRQERDPGGGAIGGLVQFATSNRGTVSSADVGPASTTADRFFDIIGKTAGGADSPVTPRVKIPRYVAPNQPPRPNITTTEYPAAVTVNLAGVLGTGGAGTLQFRLENENGTVRTGEDWAGARSVSINKTHTGDIRVRARIRDGSTPPMEGVPTWIDIPRLVAPGTFGTGGGVVQVTDPVSGTTLGGDYIGEGVDRATTGLDSAGRQQVGVLASASVVGGRDFGAINAAAGIGGAHRAAVTDGKFKTWDPDYSVADGVCLTWLSHLVKFAGRTISVPGASFSGLPGNTIIYPWFDEGLGQVGYSWTEHEALSNDRTPLDALRLAVDQAGGTGGGSESTTPGSPGSGTAVLPPP